MRPSRQASGFSSQRKRISEAPRSGFFLPRTVILITLVVLCSGCYHYHIRANGDRLNSSYFRKTLVSAPGKPGNFVVPPPQIEPQRSTGLPSSADCKANGLYEVGVSSSWKDSVGQVLSFGHWSHVNVDWLCAKEPPVIGPGGAMSDAARTRAAPLAQEMVARPTQRSQTSRKGFTSSTLHSFFWGALQKPSPALKTPPDCKSMRQVRLPMNYGHALITVFSAGIWSPMRMEFQCIQAVSP
jgi:hypothetical protein